MLAHVLSFVYLNKGFGIIGFMWHVNFLPHSRREYMFIGKRRKILFNPEGIICKIALFLHTIPSGLVKIRLNSPINIYSLREFTIPCTLRHKTDNSERFYSRTTCFF
jgi:hypothetical protein